MMTNFVYKELEEFKKEFKKLSKKYPSLKKDLKDYKDTIEAFPKGFANNIVSVSNLGKAITVQIFKIRKFPCEYLKDNRSIRIIYAYKEEIKTIEFVEIEFIEIFNKNSKENHDIDRIKKYYGR